MESSRLVLDQDHGSDAQAHSSSLPPQDDDEPPDPRFSLASPRSIASFDTVHDIAAEDYALRIPPPGILARIRTFFEQTASLVCSERINLLLVFVPVGITVGFLEISPVLDFILNALAIVPLAVVISTATENLASRIGDTFGALLNVTVGNAAELMIFFVALAKNQITIVQASLLGSVFVNLLLILGTALITGGVRFKEQLRDRPAVRLSIGLLHVGLFISIYPITLWSTLSKAHSTEPRREILNFSRGISFGLVFLYLLYLSFQMRSQAKSQKASPTPASEEGLETFAMSTFRRNDSVRHESEPAVPAHENDESRHMGPNSLRTGLVRTKWLRWIPSFRHKGYVKLSQMSDQSRDVGRSLLQHDGSSESLDSAEHEVRVEEYGVPAHPTEGSSARHSYRRQSTGQGLAILSANRTQAVPPGVLPPSPPSTVSSLADHNDDDDDMLHSPHDQYPTPPTEAPYFFGGAPRLHLPEESARRAIELKVLRRTTLQDLREHRRTHSIQSHIPVSASLTVLLFATVLASMCSEFAVDAIPHIVEHFQISPIFIGFIILPVVGNAAEHVTAAKLAMHNKFVLAKRVAVESSTQVILLITPAMVLLAWARKRELSLQVEIYEIASVVVASIAASVIAGCGRAGWKQGVVLYTVYGLIAVGSIFYPAPPPVYGVQ